MRHAQGALSAHSQVIQDVLSSRSLIAAECLLPRCKQASKCPLARARATPCRYAYVSQRGLYPDAPDKPNQDSFHVQPAFGGDPDLALFGCFDGHGEFGTECSQFAATYVRSLPALNCSCILIGLKSFGILDALNSVFILLAFNHFPSLDALMKSASVCCDQILLL